MSKISIRGGWFIWITISSVSVWSANCALAQELKPIPDNTLGAESSLVTPSTPDLPIDVIDGGAQRGANVFHSFLEFNVAEGRGAYFYSRSGDIQNILARVTGGNPSKILGTIGTYGNSNPNLFLINPNGIIFGPKASLDMGNAGLNNPRPGGSFVATTANAIRLGDNGIFSASDPARSNLLTVNPSALFFNAISGQGIVNQSTATNSVLGYSINGLQVPNGRSLLLVGGDVALEGSTLNASGGRIELGGLTEAGTVGIEIKGNNLSLNFPRNSLLSNVTLADNARVEVRSSGGGDIIVNANNFTATNGGALAAGTEGLGDAGDIIVNANEFSISGISPEEFGSGLYNQTDSTGNAGNIFINTRTFTASSGAGIFSDSLTDSSGKGGNINIETGRLTIRDGAEVRASTYSKEQGGNLSVTASESVKVIGFSAITGPSKLSTQTLGLGAGTAGNLTIQTEHLTVRDGAQVSASTSGDGQGGNLSVNASKSVELFGTSDVAPNSLFAPSGLFAESSRAGSAGNLTIQTGELTVRDGAIVSTRTFGKGSGGNLSVNALESVKLSGIAAVGSPSGLFSNNQGDTGNAGDLKIQTRQLTVRDGAQVQAGTFGEGQGGRLEVFASESIELSGTSPRGRPNSGLLNEAFGIGSAGDFTITTGQLTVQDNAVVSASTAGTGSAGNLRIQARQLTIRDGAQISAGTFGEGQGGRLEVFALESVDLSGISAKSQFEAGLYTQTEGTGSAGDLTIQTGQLTVRDGARVSTGTQDTGSAGDLTIQTGRLTIRDGAQVGTGTFDGSKGSGGNLSVIASESVEVTGSSAVGETSGLFSQTEGTGSAGDLTIQTGKLVISNGAQVSTGTSGDGKGGNLTVDAQNVQVIDRAGLVASAQPNSTGDVADLMVKTNTLLVQDGSEVTVESLGTGTAGNMTLNAHSIRLNNDALLSANTRSAKVDSNREQATININSQDLIMSRNSNIFTNARGENVIGGNINIDTDFLIGFENSDIRADSANFRGGNVRINAQGIIGIQFRDVASDKTSDITATGASPEFSGNVEINTLDVNPNSGLVNLPTIAADTEVAQTCQAGGSLAKSSFTITGRGGLPPNPGDALNTDAVQVDLVSLNPNGDNRDRAFIPSKTTTPAPERIIEATGWALNEKGEVVLTANLPTTTPHSPWLKPESCKTIPNS